MKRKKWIIGIGGSDTDDVITYIVDGTEYQVKKHLLKLVHKEKKESSVYDDFDTGTTAISEIVKRKDGSLYAFAAFRNHHTDYTATPLMEVLPLDNNGRIVE